MAKICIGVLIFVLFHLYTSLYIKISMSVVMMHGLCLATLEPSKVYRCVRFGLAIYHYLLGYNIPVPTTTNGQFRFKTGLVHYNNSAWIVLIL